MTDIFSYLVPYIISQIKTFHHIIYSVLTHGGQPLRANLRREVGEALWEVCGGRTVTFTHVEVIDIIWSHTHIQ